MPFFGIKITRKKEMQPIQIKSKNPYQITNHSFEIPKENQKRVLWIISKTVDASITVEASFSIPFFLYVVYLFIFIMQVFTLQCKIENALYDIAKEMATYGYLYRNEIPDEGNIESFMGSYLIEKSYLKYTIVEKIGANYLERSPVVDGENGIYINYSNIMINRDEIDLVVTYDVSPKIQILPIKKIPVINRCMIRAFTGNTLSDKRGQLESKTEKMVYITKDGEVYHEELTCSYLQMRSVWIQGGTQGNLAISGKDYRPCSYCIDDGEILKDGYVTLTGDCYHLLKDCSRIYREIVEIPLSKVGGRRACSKCGK